MFRTLPLLLILLASPALAAGWPGGKRTVSTSTRTLPIVGDLAGASDILALELNQAGGATTALCSLAWEALQ